MTTNESVMKGMLNKDTDVENVFKTFIVKFIGKKEFSFYNVETPEDGMNRKEYMFKEISQ